MPCSSRYSSGLSEDQSEGKERRHSHTAVSLMESESPPQLPSPTHMPHLSSGKAVLTNVGESQSTAPLSIHSPAALKADWKTLCNSRLSFRLIVLLVCISTQIHLKGLRHRLKAAVTARQQRMHLL